MPVLTSPPLLAGGAGLPVNGRVTFAPTAAYAWGERFVTAAQQAGVVRGGVFFGADAESPLELTPTPAGVGLSIVLHLEDVGRFWSREHRIARLVSVPDVSQVSWAGLDDFAPGVIVAPGAGFGAGGFGAGGFGVGAEQTVQGFGVGPFGLGVFGT